MIHITDKEFESFCELMQSEYGIDLKKKRVLIEYRMVEELKRRGMQSFQEFLDAMAREDSSELQHTMINQLTTNYTYFCREMEHYHFIEETILPNIEKGLSEFRILAAGCSSGQECYTLLMLLEEYRMRHPLPAVSLHGCDINRKVLNEAQEATYPIRSMKELPENWRKKYVEIHEAQDTFTIGARLRKQASFSYHNLLEPFHTTKYDMVLCRNVMIYFHDEARKRALANLIRVIKPKGYLVLGHAEVLMEVPQGLTYCGESVYQKI